MLPDDMMREIMLNLNYNQIIKLRCLNHHMISVWTKHFGWKNIKRFLLIILT